MSAQIRFDDGAAYERYMAGDVHALDSMPAIKLVVDEARAKPARPSK